MEISISVPLPRLSLLIVIVFPLVTRISLGSHHLTGEILALGLLARGALLGACEQMGDLHPWWALGHLGDTLGHLRDTLRHLRDTLGHLHVGHSRCY